jgi:hypothetical protein
MEPPPNVAAYYSYVKTQLTNIGSFSFLAVETPQLKSRQHRRLIGHSPDSPIFGRPILYTDQYLGSDIQYAYARHAVEPEDFLQQLDFFYYENVKDFPELQDRPFPIVMNVNGSLLQHDARFPYSTSNPMRSAVQEGIRFIRISMPFGDLAAEFGPTRYFEDELDKIHLKRLPRHLESPLFGCDVTRSTILSGFMSRIHWASSILPKSILKQAIGEFTSQNIPA